MLFLFPPHLYKVHDFTIHLLILVLFRPYHNTHLSPSVIIIHVASRLKVVHEGGYNTGLVSGVRTQAVRESPLTFHHSPSNPGGRLGFHESGDATPIGDSASPIHG